MVFKNMSEAAPPSLSELWRRDILGMKREGRAVPVKTDNERSATVPRVVTVALYQQVGGTVDVIVGGH